MFTLYEYMYLGVFTASLVKLLTYATADKEVSGSNPQSGEKVLLSFSVYGVLRHLITARSFDVRV